MQRCFVAALVGFLSLILPHDPALAAPFNAGVGRIVQEVAGERIHAIVWYPITAAEIPWRTGPFEIAATKEAPVAEGRFPLVLISHGHLGGPLAHRELAAHLAREGFIAVALMHFGDVNGFPPAASQAEVLMNRPRQAIAALDAALKDDRYAAHVDLDRIGMIGYSAGGYTGLILAGAKPDFALAMAYCRGENGRADIGSCGSMQQSSDGVPPDLASWRAPTDPRLKALVLLDPLATMFDAAGLAGITLPILLYRPEDDAYQHAQANAEALFRNLPIKPDGMTIPGRHFVFVDPCPDAVAAEAVLVCRDEPGIDRIAIHRQMQHEIAAFLRDKL